MVGQVGCGMKGAKQRHKYRKEGTSAGLKQECWQLEVLPAALGLAHLTPPHKGKTPTTSRLAVRVTIKPKRALEIPHVFCTKVLMFIIIC